MNFLADSELMVWSGMPESDRHYVVSQDDQGHVYLASDPNGPEVSAWFITRDKGKAKDVGNHLEAREIAEELNGKAIEPVYNLTDPLKRRWVVVNRID
jgi:hypothetical protein